MRRLILALVLGATGCEQLLGFQEVSVKQTPDAKVIPDAPPPPDGPPPVKVTVELPGTGGGTVQSSPAGIDCPGTCEAMFESGRKITLNQTFHGGSAFAGWGGLCADNAASCDLNPTADTTVKVTFNDNSNGNNFVFVTSENYPLNSFSPLTKADDACNAAAAKEKLPGHYVAWISSSTSAARDRLGSARGWVRPDGKPVADRLVDLLARRFYYPIDQTARGSEMNQHQWVATGTNDAGTVAPDNCNDWTSINENDHVTMGMAGWVTDGFTQGGMGSCQYGLHLYCFGIDRDKPVTPPPAPTQRVAFVSDGFIPIPLGNTSQLDTMCQMEATNAGLPGSFKALISRVGKPAAERFNAAGGPWVRVDGVQLTRPPFTLLDPNPRLITTISVTATKQYINNSRVALGSPDPEQAAFAATSCNDWQSQDPGLKHYIAHINSPWEWWASGFMPPCNEVTFGVRLYCLQE